VTFDPIGAALGVDQRNYDSREIGCPECLKTLGVAVTASLLVERDDGKCVYRCHSCGADTVRDS